MHFRAQQNPATQNNRRLCKTPKTIDDSNKTRAPNSTAAIRNGLSKKRGTTVPLFRSIGANL